MSNIDINSLTKVASFGADSMAAQRLFTLWGIGLAAVIVTILVLLVFVDGTWKIPVVIAFGFAGAYAAYQTYLNSPYYYRALQTQKFASTMASDAMTALSQPPERSSFIVPQVSAPALVEPSYNPEQVSGGGFGDVLKQQAAAAQAKMGSTFGPPLRSAADKLKSAAAGVSGVNMAIIPAIQQAIASNSVEPLKAQPVTDAMTHIHNTTAEMNDTLQVLQGMAAPFGISLA